MLPPLCEGILQDLYYEVLIIQFPNAGFYLDPDADNGLSVFSSEWSGYNIAVEVGLDVNNCIVVLDYNDDTAGDVGCLYFWDEELRDKLITIVGSLISKYS